MNVACIQPGVNVGTDAVTPDGACTLACNLRPIESCSAGFTGSRVVQPIQLRTQAGKPGSEVS